MFKAENAELFTLQAITNYMVDTTDYRRYLSYWVNTRVINVLPYFLCETVVISISDPYVKLWLCFGKERVEKKKTSIKMRTLNPVYNESFMFEIQWDKIREASIEVTCMDFDKLGRNEMIGKVLLGSKSGPLETRHWNDMISKPRQQVAQWHLLKD